MLVDAGAEDVAPSHFGSEGEPGATKSEMLALSRMYGLTVRASSLDSANAGHSSSLGTSFRLLIAEREVEAAIRRAVIALFELIRESL